MPENPDTAPSGQRRVLLSMPSRHRIIVGYRGETRCRRTLAQNDWRLAGRRQPPLCGVSKTNVQTKP